VSSQPKRLLFSHFAALARALGHEHRLELLEHLGQGERSVEQLSEATGLAFANVSQHLQLLRRNGLVEGRRAGKQVFYRVADGPVVEAVAAIQTLAEHNLEAARSVIEAYFTKLDELAPIDSHELITRLRDDTVTLIDVRPQSEFLAGHLPGARNVPLAEIEARLSDIPPSREIIAYCRGPYCVLSFEAVHFLRQRGLTARRLKQGLPEWRAAGLPVVVT
jgi:rhodanese-related sulfurtransferase/DNA-binding HxlR family transcriptional regulator